MGMGQLTPHPERATWKLPNPTLGHDKGFSRELSKAPLAKVG